MHFIFSTDHKNHWSFFGSHSIFHWSFLDRKTVFVWLYCICFLSITMVKMPWPNANWEASSLLDLITVSHEYRKWLKFMAGRNKKTGNGRQAVEDRQWKKALLWLVLHSLLSLYSYTTENHLSNGCFSPQCAGPSYINYKSRKCSNMFTEQSDKGIFSVAVFSSQLNLAGSCWQNTKSIAGTIENNFILIFECWHSRLSCLQTTL